MAYNRVGDDTDYDTFDDLLKDLKNHPNTMFVHHIDCEALVYVSMFDEIVVLECHNVWGSTEMREEALKRKLKTMLDKGVLY